MNITKKLEGTTLTIALEGRLDTTTSSEASKEVENLGDAEKLVWDFENLDYISSAGIRVLVLAQKLMSKKGGMKVINANDDIKEIFAVTGCDAIFTIE